MHLHSSNKVLSPTFLTFLSSNLSHVLSYLVLEMNHTYPSSSFTPQQVQKYRLQWTQRIPETHKLETGSWYWARRAYQPVTSARKAAIQVKLRVSIPLDALQDDDATGKYWLQVQSGTSNATDGTE